MALQFNRLKPSALKCLQRDTILRKFLHICGPFNYFITTFYLKKLLIHFLLFFHLIKQQFYASILHSEPSERNQTKYFLWVA